jgi:RecA/RadA recombinase
VKHNWAHEIIRTPIDTINIIGAGGIDQGTITELAGPPGSGKSSYAYGTAENFLVDNQDGVVIILDPELSTDLIRLEYTFKLDMSRVIIKNSRTLESGYSEIYRIIGDQDKQALAKVTVETFLSNWNLKEAIKLMKVAELEPDLSLLDDVISPKEVVAKAQRNLATLLAFRGLLKPSRPTPVLVIWDTIATSKPAAEVEAAMKGNDPRDAGGMGLRARINEINLAIVMSSLFSRPVTIFLLNQIRTTGLGSYQVTEVSSGGNALKHANHYYLWFSKARKVYDEKLKMFVGSSSKVSVRKSKFGPTINDIPIYISDQVGGKIISDDEAAMVAVDLGILWSTGGWWKTSENGSSYRWEKGAVIGDNYISKNPKLREFFLDAIARHFRKNYYTLAIVYEKIGLKLGELSSEDLADRDKIYESNVARPIFADKEAAPKTTISTATPETPKTITSTPIPETPKTTTSTPTHESLEVEGEDDSIILDPDISTSEGDMVLTEEPIIIE